MANIKVNDIQPAGMELFADTESFLNELGNDELTYVQGGLRNQSYHSSVSFACL